MVSIFPCAYLHNYRRHNQDPLDAEQYETYLEDAPAFTRGEVTKLRDFIKKSIRTGDNKELIYKIDSGRIKPSKSLQDSIAKMLKGCYVYCTDQRLAAYLKKCLEIQKSEDEK